MLNWQIGDNISIRGPRGPFRYLGRGKFKIGVDGEVRCAEAIGFVCGGSGITPAYQVCIMCMYVDMYVCMYICMYVYIVVCGCIYIYIYIVVCMHVCM